MRLAGDRLCARLPHAAPMCLLDELLSWDRGSLVCTTHSHRDPGNPLRRQGRLAAIHVIEYASQAAALHAALSAPPPPAEAQRADGGAAPRSLLAAVREIVLTRDDLDQIPGPLRVSVWRELAMGPSAIYRFLIEGGVNTVASGRLTVIGEPGT